MPIYDAFVVATEEPQAEWRCPVASPKKADDREHIGGARSITNERMVGLPSCRTKSRHPAGPERSAQGVWRRRIHGARLARARAR